MSNEAALLVIDVQRCMFEASPPAHGCGALLARIGSLIDRARAAGVPVIFVQHCGSEGEVHEPGTEGWEIHPSVAPAPDEVVIQKRHPDSFQGTALRAELQARGINSLIITGLQTEFCVDTTCRRAYSLGYDVILIQDGHSTWDTDDLTARQIIAHHNVVLGSWFAVLKAADEVEFSD